MVDTKPKIKIKLKIPKIQIDSKGQRFIRIKSRKVLLKDGLSERELIAFIVKQLTQKKTIRIRKRGWVGPRLKRKRTYRPRELTAGLPPTSKATFITPENAPEFFQHQVALTKLQHKLEEPIIVPADRPRILPSEILALAPPDLSDADKKKYVDQYFKDIYQMSVKEANEYYQKALVDRKKALDDSVKAKEDSIKANAEVRRLGIFRVIEKFKTQTKSQLINYAENHGVALSNPSKMAKEDIFQAIVNANAVDFEKMYDLEKASKIPIRLKPKDASASSGQGKGTDQGLSTEQINKMMSTSDHFLGTIASDQIKELNIQPRTPFAFVMNTDPSSKSGEHWVACFSDGKSSIEYYDSFADPPSKAFMKDVKWIAYKLQPDTYLKFKQNKIIEQDNNSSNCGYFACRFLIDRLRGKPFAECTKYDDSIKGEKNIEAWKAKLHIKPFKYIKPSQDGEGLKEIYQGVKDGLTKVKDRVIHAYKTVTTGSHRLNFAPSIRKLLEQYGEQKITSIKVCRKPIHSVLSKVINWVSQGVFQKNLQELGYDKAFHLFLLIRLENGKIIKAEKNQVINIVTTSDWTQNDAESVEIGASSSTLAQFFEKGRASIGDQKYYVYDSKTQNCQKWVEANLRANGLWSPSISRFVLQDAEAIYKGLGYIEKANKVITDVAGVADHVLKGAGNKPPRVDHAQASFQEDMEQVQLYTRINEEHRITIQNLRNAQQQPHISEPKFRRFQRQIELTLELIHANNNLINEIIADYQR